MRKKKTPHQRIMRAAEAGRGLRLSADDVERLAIDDAIKTKAEADDLMEVDPSDTLTWRAAYFR